MTCSSSSTATQGPSCGHTCLVGSTAEDNVLGVTTDSLSNVIFVGHAKGPLQGKSSFGLTDLVVGKLSKSGALQWIHQLGSDQSDSATGVAMDLQDNIYVSAYTAGNLKVY